MGTCRGRGRPKVRWVDNVTKWNGRSVHELRKAATEREHDGGVSSNVPPLQSEDEAATDTSLCWEMLFFKLKLGISGYFLFH